MMLDKLYDNIGGKVKRLAKWTFIVGTIGALIIGLALIFIYEDLILYGFVTLIYGSIVAWVSSWTLYAFGELVEKTSENENNTRNILKQVKKFETNNNNQLHTKYANHGKKEIESTHKWLCDGCKKMRTQSPYEHCGKE